MVSEALGVILTYTKVVCANVKQPFTTAWLSDACPLIQAAVARELASAAPKGTCKFHRAEIQNSGETFVRCEIAAAPPESEQTRSSHSWLGCRRRYPACRWPSRAGAWYPRFQCCRGGPRHQCGQNHRHSFPRPCPAHHAAGG